MKKTHSYADLHQGVLIADILAVLVLSLLALTRVFQIKSVFLGVVFNLAILPSIFFVGLSLLYSLFLLVFHKNTKSARYILFCSLFGIAIILFMQMNFP